MTAKPWLEYRLEQLTFANGGVLGFRKARMLYNEDDQIIAIEHIGASPQQIDRALQDVGIEAGEEPEIREIRYAMRVDGYPDMIFFYHPLSRGSRVRLLPREQGRTRLFFSQQDGLQMFSKEWTLADVTAGKIPSDRTVWQFHGWRHEH